MSATDLRHLGALPGARLADQHQRLVGLQRVQQVVAQREHGQSLALLLQTERHVRVVDERGALQGVGVRAVLRRARPGRACNRGEGGPRERPGGRGRETQRAQPGPLLV